jgi:16S rRNA C967 or C1407 C5-methylase (RsmB/RsmF family)
LNPAQGDGTMRKSPDIWNRWGVAAGNGLHMMQLKIALQGARLLKVQLSAPKALLILRAARKSS